MYKYKATILKVIDGDTVKLKIDLGFKMYWICNCRLAEINAPEIDSEQGKQSKKYLSDILPIDTEIQIESIRLDKYGRPLVKIHLKDLYINEHLIDMNYATRQ